MNVLYTMDGCSVCARAIHHLNKRDIPYRVINIFEENSAKKELKELIGEVYTPVLVHDEGLSIGRDILEFKDTNSSK
ncbi:glutaredoxin family protein [Halobacillus campisalis]|uniref:Glutaredoxin family protein n=1 Tax=Halobacillus campisalis TaxID=435909 RepID=A0ABW2K8F1_9BACI|nr:glutaredoxin [Halobacillus campisalis]